MPYKSKHVLQQKYVEQYVLPSVHCNFSEQGISNIETEVQLEWRNMEHRQCQEIPFNYTIVFFF